MSCSFKSFRWVNSRRFLNSVPRVKAPGALVEFTVAPDAEAPDPVRKTPRFSPPPIRVSRLRLTQLLEALKVFEGTPAAPPTPRTSESSFGEGRSASPIGEAEEKQNNGHFVLRRVKRSAWRAVCGAGAASGADSESRQGGYQALI